MMKLRNLRIKSGMLHAMCSSDDVAAVDEGTSASDPGELIVNKVLQVHRPWVLVDRVGACLDTATT